MTAASIGWLVAGVVFLLALALAVLNILHIRKARYWRDECALSAFAHSQLKDAHAALKAVATQAESDRDDVRARALELTGKLDDAQKMILQLELAAQSMPAPAQEEAQYIVKPKRPSRKAIATPPVEQGE